MDTHLDTDFERAYRRADGSIDIEFYKLRAARLRSRAARRAVHWEKLLPLAPYVLAVFRWTCRWHPAADTGGRVRDLSSR